MLNIFGKDFLNSHVLRWRRKVYSDWEDVTIFRQGVPGLWVSYARYATDSEKGDIDVYHMECVAGECISLNGTRKSAYFTRE